MNHVDTLPTAMRRTLVRTVPPSPRAARTARITALGAVVGPALFTFAWVILGFVSPGYTIGGTRIAPYSPISQPVSGLGMGITAPYMNAAFVLGAGLLTMIGVVGAFATLRDSGKAARRAVCAGLLCLSPLGLGLCGIFTIEYPMVHLACFLLFVLTPMISFPVAGLFLRRIPGWRRFGTALVVAVPVTLAILVWFFLSYDQTAITVGRGISGIPERILLIELQAWFVALGWLAYRRASHSSAASSLR
jgi:hypothetical membrane protein